MGEVAKTYMINITNGLHINLRISSYIGKPFLIHDFAAAPFWISLYVRKILFTFFYQYRVKKYLYVAACVDTVVWLKVIKDDSTI
jgi:hypothetical protein